MKSKRFLRKVLALTLSVIMLTCVIPFGTLGTIASATVLPTEATGIFGQKWTERINTIAYFMDTTPYKMERYVSGWLNNASETDTTASLKADSFDKLQPKLTLQLFFIEAELDAAPAAVRRDMLGSDVFYKQIAKIIEFAHSEISEEYQASVLQSFQTGTNGIIDEVKKYNDIETPGEYSLANLVNALNGAKTAAETETPDNRSKIKKLSSDIYNYYKDYLPTTQPAAPTNAAERASAYFDSRVAFTEENIEKALLSFSEDFKSGKINSIEKFMEAFSDAFSAYSTALQKATDDDDTSALETFCNENDLLKYIVLSAALNMDTFYFNYENMSAFCSCLPDDREELIEIFKCYLNSDVMFKATSKMMEAVATGNGMTLITTGVSIFPPIFDELAKGVGGDEYVYGALRLALLGEDITDATTDENGTINLPYYGVPGDGINVSVTPKTGYTLDKLTVTKTGDDSVKVECIGNCFIMPDYPVTVSASFKRATLVAYITYYKADGTPTEKILFSYDENGRVISQTSQSYDAAKSVFNDSYRGTYEYDANGNVTKEAWSSFDGTKWCDGNYTTKEYDDNGNLIRNTEYWGVDQPFSKTEYEIFEDHTVVTGAYYEGGEWEPWDDYTEIYYAKVFGKTVETSRIYYEKDGASTKLIGKCVYTYDSYFATEITYVETMYYFYSGKVYNESIRYYTIDDYGRQSKLAWSDTYYYSDTNIQSTMIYKTSSYDEKTGNKICLRTETDSTVDYEYTYNSDGFMTRDETFIYKAEEMQIKKNSCGYMVYVPLSNVDVTYDDTLGTVETDDSAVEGDEIEVKIIPNAGYSIDTVSFVCEGKTTTVSANGDGKFLITMPATSIVVTVTFKAIVPPTSDASLAISAVAVLALCGGAVVLGKKKKED